MPYCVFGTGISLFIVPLGWNNLDMAGRVFFVVIALLSFYGLYKAVRFLVGETADEVEFDKKKASHHIDLHIRKIKKLIAAKVLISCMFVGNFVLLYFWYQQGDPDAPMVEAPLTIWIEFIAILVLIFVLASAMDKIDKEFEKLVPLPKDTDDEFRLDKKKVRHYMELLKSFSRNAIQISLVGNGNVPLTAGCSKLGGRPDVANDFQWPHDNSGYPLSLLLQIDCAELASLDHEGLLPTSGHLYFFYELSEMRRDGKKNSVRVIYNDKPSSQLHPLDYPVNLGKHYQLQECRLQFSQRTSFPCLEEVGHLTHKRVKTKDNIELADLSDHVLLLQLDSSEYWEEDDKTPHELQFGNGGCIYFYIKREDLLARRFDSITFALQCF